jgi:hypothetical protein
MSTVSFASFISSSPSARLRFDDYFCSYGGLYHVSAVGFHPEAMKNLLNITHTKTKAIPKTIAFHMLVHVAVIVDYYDMREAMTLYTGL